MIYKLEFLTKRNTQQAEMDELTEIIHAKWNRFLQKDLQAICETIVEGIREQAP